MGMEIPKNVFDKEYSTQWRREVQFLEEKGINYTYAKKHAKYPIIRYKYTKTPELFLALTEFYKKVYVEQLDKKIEEAKSVLPLEKGCIDVKASDMTEPEMKLMDFQEQEVEKVLEDD